MSPVIPSLATSSLLQKQFDSYRLASRRRRFLEYILQSRAANLGLTAITSSRIELFPHQVEVVRRVLEDPVQRYLLADEVGLGKTIQAGILLRQFLLDEPTGRALIVVPRHLIGQWQQELIGKLALDRFKDRFDLVTSDRVRDSHVNQRALSMLIVDEAHHQVADAFNVLSDGYFRYQKLQRIAHRVPRVLLLSATPVLHNEREFLAMLHLLDPVAHPLQDLEGFTRKVGARQDIGKLLLNLKDHIHPVPLRTALQQLENLFSDDSYIRETVEKIRDGLLDAEVRVPLVRALRIHLNETYRLHRRMLRNRRDSVTKFVDHRTSHELIFSDDDERLLELAALLEEWRVRVQVHLQGKDAASHAKWRRLYLLLASTLSSWIQIFGGVVGARLGKQVSWLSSEFSRQELDAILQLPRMEGERELLEAMFALVIRPSSVERVTRMFDVLDARHGSHPHKIVIFTAFQTTAKYIYCVAKDRYGFQAIAAQWSGTDDKQRRAALNRFLRSPECRFLICDSSSEEGLNLQAADAIVHFDLPFSPNRIEQRMGRLDRLGREKIMHAYILAGPDHEASLEKAWVETMAGAFKVFQRSIASLQFLVDSSLDGLLSVAFTEGAEGLRIRSQQLAAEIEVEQVRIAEQQAIDEIEASDTCHVEEFERMHAFDHQTRIHYDALSEWAVEALGMRRVEDEEGGLTFEPHRAVDFAASAFQAFPAVLDRGQVIDQSNVGILRAGHPFIDALVAHFAQSPQGRSAAYRLLDARWPMDADPWLGFVCSFAIESNPMAGEQMLTESWNTGGSVKAYRRRLDTLQPPRHVQVVVDARLNLVSDDPRVREILDQPDRARIEDLSLRTLHQMIPSAYWEGAVQSAREVAELALRESPAFIDFQDQASRFARGQLELRLAQLRHRLARSVAESMHDAETLQQDLQREESLAAAILEGIHDPLITLDSMAMVVIAHPRNRL